MVLIISMPADSGENPQNRLAQPTDLDLNEFFDSGDRESVVRNDDLESIVPNKDKHHLIEEDRYWVNKPFAYAVIFQSTKDLEYQYYLVEPHLNQQERKLVTFLKDKIRLSLDYDSIKAQAPREERGKIIRQKTYELMDNYNLLSPELVGEVEQSDPLTDFLNSLADKIYSYSDNAEPTIRGDDMEETPVKKLNRRQAETVIYYIIRDYIGYERIDGVMKDSQVEDTSQAGWNENVFVVHSEYGQMITNITFGKENLDRFIVNLAQKAEKGISKRQPDVDATLEDGSRSLLILGDEITDRGSSFDIRQFNRVPFTPIDLINWGTYSIDMMVYLWLCVEAGKSAIVAGGTASGKTTTLNAMSLFIPATNKIVSIEDTREIQIPQKNWKSMMTREAFGDEGKGDIMEYELLEDALRMRPNYVVFGEVRGPEARSLFQIMNSGHTTFSTFHGKDSEKVRVRLTSEPINVDETTFSGLDLIINQEEVSISGEKKRRCNSIDELGEYDTGTGKFTVKKPFIWDSSNDKFEGSLTSEHMDNVPDIIDEIRHEEGWNVGELESEINRRRVVLAYLLKNDMNSYTDVAAVIQAYMNNKDNVLSRIGEGSLKKDVEVLKQMKNININVSEQVEADMPRPASPRPIQSQAKNILDNNQEVVEDIDRSIDTSEFEVGDERRLKGDTYESTTRTVDREAPDDESDEDTVYGFDDSAEVSHATDEDGDGDRETVDPGAGMWADVDGSDNAPDGQVEGVADPLDQEPQTAGSSDDTDTDSEDETGDSEDEGMDGES